MGNAFIYPSSVPGLKLALDTAMTNHDMALYVDLPETEKIEQARMTKELSTIVCQEVYLAVFRKATISGVALMVVIRDALVARGYTTQTVIMEESAQVNNTELIKAQAELKNQQIVIDKLTAEVRQFASEQDEGDAAREELLKHVQELEETNTQLQDKLAYSQSVLADLREEYIEYKQMAHETDEQNKAEILNLRNDILKWESASAALQIKLADSQSELAVKTAMLEGIQNGSVPVDNSEREIIWTGKYGRRLVLESEIAVNSECGKADDDNA